MLNLPSNEVSRLQALRALAILDTAAEACFDEIVQAAALVCKVPISLISLVDEQRQWFKARVGLDVNETTRDIAFCRYTILAPDTILEVQDATKDVRFSDNPLVTANPNIRFYAGYPLSDVNGHSLGTLCVIDRQPRQLEPWQREVLSTLARQAMRLLAARASARQLDVWHDQQERITLQKQVHESLTRFDLIVSGASIGIWETKFDPECWESQINNDLVFYWSPRFAQIMGYDISEFPPRLEPWITALHPDDLQRTLNAVHDCLSYGVPYNIEYRLKTRNGEYRWYQANGEAERDAQGRPVRMAGSMADITPRKRDEAMLEKARSQLMDAIGSIDAGIAMYDAEDYLVVVNQQFADMYGVDSSYIPQGVHFSQVLSVLQETGALKAIANVEQWKQEQTTNHQIPGQDKEYQLAGRWIRISERRTADGGIVSLHTDITALKETVDVQSKARGIAEQAAQAKAEFLATMSHELRTPMNGVIGMTSLLLETNLDEEQRDFAATARQCGDNLLSLINDILDFSKIEAGHLVLEQIPFSPRRMAEEAIALFVDQAQTKGLEIICEVGADVPSKVLGDPTRLRQVVLNLLGNAVKFTERGEVVMSLLRRPGKGNVVPLDLIIRDTGIGIAEEERHRLFKPFSQADSSTTRKYGGTGLGLVICQRLVSLMGGDINLVSEMGKGSTFTCHIALQEAEDIDPSLHTQNLIGRHVIIAAGHPTARRVLRDQLVAWGMTCEEATNEADIQCAIKRKEPALVVIDNDIADGALAAGRAVRAAHAHVPLILLTGAAHRGMAASAQAVGFTGFLTKPIRQAQLFDGLLMVFDQSCRVPKHPGLSPSKMITRHTLAEDRPQRRVLVVEDNEVNRQVAVMMLGKLGCHCDIATNGKEAVEALAKKDYQVVFMDCQMPIMDGFAATRAIRRSEADRRRTRIVALTANAMSTDQEKCLAAGMDDYLSKPVKQIDLAEALKRTDQVSIHELSAVITTTEELPDIDGCALIGLRDATDIDTVRTVIGMLRDEVPSIIADLEQAITKQDTIGLARLAHRLKGSTGTLGLRRIQMLCQDLETAARARDINRSAQLGHTITATLTVAIPLLEQHPVVVGTAV